MPDPNETLNKSQEEILAEADLLSAELNAEIESMNIGDMSSPLELTPEMLENMDPAQIQALMAQMNAAGKQRKPQAFYTRKRTPKAIRRAKGRAQKKARAITRRNGGGRTISARRRKAA